MNDPIMVITTGIIFGGLLGLIIGMGVGIFIGRRNKPSQEVEVEQITTPPPPAPARNAPKDSLEVLSLWRNDRTGKLIALLESKPVSPSHLTSDQKAKISQLLTGLHAMIGEPPPSPLPVPALPEPAPVQSSPIVAPVFLKEDPIESLPSPQAETRVDAEAPLTTEQPQKVFFADTLPEPVTIGQALLSNPFKITPPAASQKPISTPKSIIEQIDEILQAKLVGTPYESQNIQLKESLNGMTILMGVYKYEGVDAVPDATVRALIKESAREWNEKVSRKR